MALNVSATRSAKIPSGCSDSSVDKSAGLGLGEDVVICADTRAAIEALVDDLVTTPAERLLLRNSHLRGVDVPKDAPRSGSRSTSAASPPEHLRSRSGCRLWIQGSQLDS